MPTEGTAAPRRIVLRGLSAETLASELTISIVDDAGVTVHSAPVDEDGCYEVPEEALASAREVLVGTIGVHADEFRRLLHDDVLDVAALLARPMREAPASLKATAGGFPGGSDDSRPPDHPDSR